MALRPSYVPQRVVLPEPPASSLPHVTDPESDLARAASSTVICLLTTVLTDPDLQSTAAFSLVTKLFDFAARSRLDYVASLVTESESVCPPSVGGEPTLSSDVFPDRQFELECLAPDLPRFASMLFCPKGDPDALDIPTPRSYAEAIAGEYSSQWQTAMEAAMASWKSTGTYVDEVPPPGVNIVDGMWIFIVKRPPGSPPAFKARYVTRGFSQRQGVDFFQTFSPTPKMTTLRVLLHIAAQHNYELHSLNFSTAFLQGSLHEEIWLCRPRGFTGSFPPGETHLHLPGSFSASAFSSPRHCPLSTGHSLSAPPSDESVEPSGPYLELVGYLMYVMTCTRPDLATSGMGLVLEGQGSVVFTGHSDASWADDQATQHSCETEIYAGAMGAHELRWLTYVLTNLGERPRPPPVLYVDNKAMLAMCHEQRLEHRTKHIALCYFLARELQQRRQLRLSYVASRANTADVSPRPLGLSRAALLSRTALHCPTASASTAATAPIAAMASPTVLTFDAEGRAVDFDVWWTTRDAVARLAVCSHLPPAERAHFGQYKMAQSLYDDVVAHYSSPATAALRRLMLPYLFPDLAAFVTVADLVAHLRTSDARYRAALPTEFCAKKPPPMYITLYYLVTRLPDSLSSIRDHFLSLCPTELPVDMLEERLSTAKKSILAVCASRGVRRTPFFEGRSELRLPLVGGAATTRARGAMVVEGAAGAAVEAVEAVEEAGGVAVEVGVVPGVGASVAAVEVVEEAAEVVEAAAAAVEAAAAVVAVAAALVLVEVQPHNVEALVVASASSSLAPVRPRRPSSFVSGTLGVGGLGNVPIFDLNFDAILAAMYALTDSAEGDCYLSVPPDPGIAAVALGVSASPAPGTGESAAPGAGESDLSSTVPTEALHTFTLDSGALRFFFRDSTTLTPLSRPVAVSLADPSGGPVLAHSSTVLPCPAAPSGLLSGLHLPSFSTNLVSGADLKDAWVDQFAPGGQRVTHCTCSWTGRHLATFTRRPGSSLYTLNTAPPPVSASSQVAATSQMFAAASRSSSASAPCSCRPLSHETLLWHHRLGHPSLPRLRGMASRTLVSGLPQSLPPLPPGPAPTCVPCVEGRQHAAPHSSTFPPTEAPLQTLHMDVWGPARVRGQGHERYFLLVVDDYSRYTTVFPLRCKGEVPEVLIGWIRGARCQLSESFGSELLVLGLHSDRGGEFSSDLLSAFCCAKGIRQTFALPASPQQNVIAEHRIGMVMDVARTSMIHAAAPHFLWPFADQYAVHKINLQPRVSLPVTTPTLRWMGKVGDASAFFVWGSRAFVHDTSADKLSSRAVPFGVLGFPLDAPGW
ncbi:unnamed protein product [Closterium sp. NIES-53]